MHIEQPMKSAVRVQSVRTQRKIPLRDCGIIRTNTVMRKTATRARVDFRLPAPLVKMLESRSEKTGLTKTKIVEFALREYLARKP
jgi:hypothetical protein